MIASLIRLEIGSSPFWGQTRQIQFSSAKTCACPYLTSGIEPDVFWLVSLWVITTVLRSCLCFSQAVFNWKNVFQTGFILGGLVMFFNWINLDTKCGCGHFGSRFQSRCSHFWAFFPPFFLFTHPVYKKAVFYNDQAYSIRRLSSCPIYRSCSNLSICICRLISYTVPSAGNESANHTRPILRALWSALWPPEGSWASSLFHQLATSPWSSRRRSTYSPEAVRLMQTPDYSFRIHDSLRRRYSCQRRRTWPFSPRLLSMVWTFVQKMLVYRWQEGNTPVDHWRWVWND